MSGERVSAGDFLRLGVLLATLRRASDLPRATLVAGYCPNCGDVWMLKERGQTGVPTLHCQMCPYTTTDFVDTVG